MGPDTFSTYCSVHLLTLCHTLHPEKDKSSDIERQPPFGDCKYSNTLPQNIYMYTNIKKPIYNTIHIQYNIYMYTIYTIFTKHRSLNPERHSNYKFPYLNSSEAYRNVQRLHNSLTFFHLKSLARLK